jgi:hypothetical protein
MNRPELSNRLRDFWRDFNTENHWSFPELPPSDILRSLDSDISDVDHDEFVRAHWMWKRRPGPLLGKTLVAYVIAALIGFVFLLIPDAGVPVACCWLFGMFLVIAQDVVRLVRWRRQYESSIARVIRTGAK